MFAYQNKTRLCTHFIIIQFVYNPRNILYTKKQILRAWNNDESLLHLL